MYTLLPVFYTYIRNTQIPDWDERILQNIWNRYSNIHKVQYPKYIISQYSECSMQVLFSIPNFEVNLNQKNHKKSCVKENFKLLQVVKCDVLIVPIDYLSHQFMIHKVQLNNKLLLQSLISNPNKQMGKYEIQFAFNEMQLNIKNSISSTVIGIYILKYYSYK